MLKFKRLIEEWKDIPDYEGYYQASNFGRIRSIERFVDREYSLNGKSHLKEKILKQTNRNGYLLVKLTKYGKSKTFSVHRLVWAAFNGPIPAGMQVNHLDENPRNNSLFNLNLMSCKENNNWGTRTKRAAEKLTNGKCSKATLQYSTDGKLIMEWESMSEIQRKKGYNISLISRCCNNSLWHKTAYGYIWKYK